jgi:hypothetical protein
MRSSVKKRVTRRNKQGIRGNKKSTRKKQKSFNFKKLNCGPSTAHKKNTCYTNASLHKLKYFWNKRHPEKRIKANNPAQIWKQLKYYMLNTCNTERCWLSHQFIKLNLDKTLKSNTFAPKSPKSWIENPREWLSSVDIVKVMAQYEHTYKNFAFIGPSPIDFDTKKLFGTCVWEDLCNFNLNEHIKKKKNKLGIIFNLDPHFKGGSHWVCLFVDLKKKFIFYFDSNGISIPKQIKKCVTMIQLQSIENLKFFQNAPKVHQQQDTECGIYVLYVISSLIEESVKYTHFMKNNISDEDMFKLRNKYFNEHTSAKK